MLRLSIARATAPTDAPGPDEPGVEVWRHHDGSVIAYGGSRASDHWMNLIDVGLFVFGGEAELVTAYPHSSADDELVEDAFRRMVLPMALQALGVEVLHASAVRGERGAVALSAVSETGKSTLAYGLSRRGYELWADDAVAFELGHADVTAIPLPFKLRLRVESAEFFGNDGSAEVVSSPEPAPLAAVCALERASAGGLERLDPTEAFPTVLTHAYCFSLADDERKHQMLATYLELVTRVPVFRVRLEEGLDRLPAVLERLDEAVNAATTPAA